MSAIELLIRDAEASDIGFIADANAAMAWETEHKALDPATLARGVAAVFEQPARGFYLVAQRAGEAVGCLMVTREWSDWRDGDWWWLQSVYVIREARRHGVFRALYAEVERRAGLAAGVVGLRLYVEKNNRSALATYETLGMVETEYRLLERAGAWAEAAP
ncbi:MAG: GNAT family N-acetyltransferase [Dokdonella sp.]